MGTPGRSPSETRNIRKGGPKLPLAGSGQAEKAEPAARGRQRRQSPPEGPGQRGKGRNGAAMTPGKRGRGRARAASGQEEQRIPGQSKTPGQAELHV